VARIEKPKGISSIFKTSKEDKERGSDASIVDNATDGEIRERVNKRKKKTKRRGISQN
jgi:hypothetical protein